MSTLETIGFFFLALGLVNFAIAAWLVLNYRAEHEAARRNDDAARYRGIEVSP